MKYWIEYEMVKVSVFFRLVKLEVHEVFDVVMRTNVVDVLQTKIKTDSKLSQKVSGLAYNVSDIQW